MRSQKRFVEGVPKNEDISFCFSPQKISDTPIKIKSKLNQCKFGVKEILYNCNQQDHLSFEACN